MARVGTDENPLRIAVVGAGPAGFYVAEALVARKELAVEVDLIERLPMPFGLVRFGVAPDHEKIKKVTKVYDRILARENVRYYGSVTYGEDVSLEDLARHYHQICFTTGAETDRRMGIPGEDLARSYTATEFVAWYNGHPDYRERVFDLSHERVAIVGVGNVAVDVARILCRTDEELRKTDIADHALAALRESRVREVVMLGRRGPAQAAFTNPEVRELGALPGAEAVVVPEEIAPDPLSKAHLEANPAREVLKKMEILESFLGRDGTGAAGKKRLVLRFLVSPTEIHDDGAGGVSAMTLVRNELYQTDGGSLRPRATDSTERLDCGVVFRSVGYRGVALPDLPFHERWGTVPNASGRVIDGGEGAALAEGGRALPGVYVAGWIKRGPTGVIGTNKADAQETVRAMLEDLEAGRILDPERPAPAAFEAFVRGRAPELVTYEAWRKIDAFETERGAASGRPRVKCVTAKEVRAAIAGG